MNRRAFLAGFGASIVALGAPSLITAGAESQAIVFRSGSRFYTPMHEMSGSVMITEELIEASVRQNNAMSRLVEEEFDRIMRDKYMGLDRDSYTAYRRPEVPGFLADIRVTSPDTDASRPR